MTDATPISDEEGKSLEPFTFTLENVCTTETSYVVNLETLSSGDKILADNYIKANLINGSNEVFFDNLLGTHINEEKVIEEAATAYKLHQGKLGNKEKISFNLRLWMDEATEALDEVMNAAWQGKVTVTATYIPPSNMKNVIKKATINEEWIGGGTYETQYDNILYTNDGRYRLSKIVYQSSINAHLDAIEIVDFSADNDKSVLGYYVRNTDITDDEKYILYIQADDKIKVGSDGSNLLYYSEINPTGGYSPIFSGKLYDITFEGIENLDTSNTILMNNMFYYFPGETLNLKSFNTSKVTNMSDMFFDCTGLTTLNLGNFDTSNVTDMSFMFYQVSNLTTTINITNPNVEDYDRMFYRAATEEGAQITVNYTEETSDLVDRMIETKSENSNVVKGSLIP